jgi:hypothetical protein
MAITRDHLTHVLGIMDRDIGRLYGLDRPVMELTLQIGGRDDVPEERVSLLVGKSFPADGNLVYVKRRNSPVVSLTRAGFVARINNMVAQTPKS